MCGKKCFFPKQWSFICKLRTYIQNLSSFATTEICSLWRCLKICLLQIRALLPGPHTLFSVSGHIKILCIFLITQASCFCTRSAFCLQRHFPSPYLSDKLLLSLKARSCSLNCDSYTAGWLSSFTAFSRCCCFGFHISSITSFVVLRCSYYFAYSNSVSHLFLLFEVVDLVGKHKHIFVKII